MDMKTIRYFALLLIATASFSSCAVNNDAARKSAHYYHNGTDAWNFKQAGYASVHSRPPIN